VASYEIAIRNIKSVVELSARFEFDNSDIIALTGKNGAGKTTLANSFALLSDAQIFKKAAGLDSVRFDSSVTLRLGQHQPCSFRFNSKISALDSKDTLPPKNSVLVELPIPFGSRFRQFALVANYDAELRANIAASRFFEAEELIIFLNEVYPDRNYVGLKAVDIGKHRFYFIPLESNYYIREDHFSSGEFFLIQLFRLATSGAELIIIDELDVALDASAQVRLYKAIKPLLQRFSSKLIVISHSLAFISTVDDGGLYYLENTGDGVSRIERRSFGYVKSDLYGFRGKDRYIITEDDILRGFLRYLINAHVQCFFEYEIISVGGQPQIESIARRNDADQIFGASEHLLIVVDRDILDRVRYQGPSKICSSPVNDIELFIWENRERLLPDCGIDEFAPAKKPKDTAKTYWRKLLSSKTITEHELFQFVERENKEKTDDLIATLKNLLCLH